MLTTRVGEVVRWDNDRGFGFIAPDDGGSNVFVHVSDLAPGSPRPHVGDRVDYALERDDRGRMHAARVTVHGDAGEAVAPVRRRPQRWSVVEMLAVLGFAVLLATGVLLYDMSAAIPLVVILISVVTAFAYADDKRRAEEGRWRTSESSLLLLCLLGGWPGAIAAMRWYRHKTTKASFVGAFWVTVFVTLIAFTLIAFPAARDAVITSLELMSGGA
ncbi:DUF1294 domain-containing protein [Microcella sp.]|uniref:DUF1294 domain-containing protein n=1 Tax=Microcella sp. TaxID=1913979 RepID=UPI00391BA9B5